MSFQQGLSGLNGSTKMIEVIGNNIANANTTGFKSATTKFADVYANSLGGAGGAGSTGIGTKVTQVLQQFSQGNVSTSSNPLDIAINGGGFFRLSNGGSISYSRNGEFILDKSGNIVNAQGDQLTGYNADANGVLSTGAPTPLFIQASDLAPRETTTVLSSVNLDSGASTPVVTPFNHADATSYNNSTSVNIFDSLGSSHVLQTYFAKSAVANTWDIYATSDGVPVGYVPPAAPVSVGTITFTSAGVISSPIPPTFPIAVPVNNGANTPFTVNYNLNASTQFGAPFTVKTLDQDGYTSGRLTGFGAGSDGIIVGRYTNGKSQVLGQVVLTNFRNPNGLQPQGNNGWTESSDSGVPLVGIPKTGSLGSIQASAIEVSNTDLTAELVSMITAQRVYQANAQTIKAQDQMLQTLVNLR
jgi:flagellar hook protein FlgE